MEHARNLVKSNNVCRKVRKAEMEGRCKGTNGEGKERKRHGVEERFEEPCINISNCSVTMRLVNFKLSYD